MYSQAILAVSASAFLFLTACGDSSSEAPASQVDAEESGAAASSVAAESVQAGNGVTEVSSRRGMILFLQCRACHDLDVNGINKVGPSLYGIVGSAAGTKAGFTYSDAMKSSAIVWSMEALEKFIENPAAHVPGTIMAFVGIRDADDRAALLGYLAEQSATDK